MHDVTAFLLSASFGVFGVIAFGGWGWLIGMFSALIIVNIDLIADAIQRKGGRK